MFRITTELYDKIKYFAKFPQMGVSLRQMVMFGQNPSQGTLLRASMYLHEELPVRLAHRVKELDELPHGLSEMPSIKKVKNWYAQSFQDLIELPPPELSQSVKEVLKRGAPNGDGETVHLPPSIPNPSIKQGTCNGSTSKSLSYKRRYYANVEDFDWPREVHNYNDKLTKVIEIIKRRHDPVVTTMGI
ncbi:uncharacterized protein VTP21DRAFT_11562 [Calcarisporiella thermophila]|uniref:uncharacterized protein n=1 Tax=Calcarisporiella thermophila TaxID=911321 RepID=UPI0037430304